MTFRGGTHDLWIRYWLAAGGMLYTVGIVFYAFDERFKHWHGIWHLFVVGGSAMHFIAILFFVL